MPPSLAEAFNESLVSATLAAFVRSLRDQGERAKDACAIAGEYFGLSQATVERRIRGVDPLPLPDGLAVVSIKG